MRQVASSRLTFRSVRPARTRTSSCCEANMQVLKIVRKFNYNGIALVDPNPALSIDAVREFYATQYP